MFKEKTYSIHSKTFVKLKKTSYFGWTWHGMASSHYCKDFIEWLKSINIQLVAKKDNAPKVCSTRPIERFWALRKGKQIQLNL